MNSFYEQDYDNKPKFSKWENFKYWCGWIAVVLMVVGFIVVTVKLMP